MSDYKLDPVYREIKKEWEFALEKRVKPLEKRIAELEAKLAALSPDKGQAA